MNHPKFVRLLMAAALCLVFAIGCAPAQQAEEPAAVEETHSEEPMAAPDTSMMADTTAASGDHGSGH